MDREKLKTLFATVADLSAEEVQKRLPLLELSATQVEQRLKPSTDVAAHEDAILLFVAVLCQYYDALSRATGATAVRVADLSVTENGEGRLQQLKHLKEELEGVLAPLMTDQNFLFYLIS